MMTSEELEALIKDYRETIALLDKYKLEKRTKDIEAAKLKMKAIMVKADDLNVWNKVLNPASRAPK